jgi:peptidoglycan lytic transglycosylase D
MTRIFSKSTTLFIGVLFLISCGTLNHIDKSGSASPELALTNASSESFTVPLQETISKDAKPETVQPSSEEPTSPSPESTLPVSPGASDPDTSTGLTGPADAVPDGAPDALDTDAVENDPSAVTENDSTNDSGNDSEEEITYDVPIVLNESVEDYIEYFQTQIRDKFKLWLERSGRYIPVMREIFKEHGLPEDLVFVALIESGFNPFAYSRSRAVGHWQFIKGTGRLYGLRIDNWIDERRDPIKSTRAAARYLKDLYGRFGSWPLAMAGYNAGERKIQRALVKSKSDDFWGLRSSRYIRRETKGYVPKFMAATIIAKNPERYGFTLDYHEPLQYDTVSVSGSADLRVVARAAGVPYEDIKELNPELRTELTPPYMEEYLLRLPVGTKQTFTDAYSQIPDDRKIIGTQYKIHRNDSLSRIAKRFGTSIALLRDINHMTKGQLLREGDVLFIPKLRSIPSEPKRRVVAAAGHGRHKKESRQKKAPIQMASLETHGKTDFGEEGNKILYLVKDGDTLWDISQSFNVSVHDLKRYNGMGKRSMIRPGDQLVLGFQSKDL